MKYLLLILVGLTFHLLPCYADEFYIAADGNDANLGTKSKPFATLERAREAIRQLKKVKGLPSDGVTVWLHEGEYHIQNTFELCEEDSGSSTSRIVYRACSGAKVSLIGGVEISPFAFEPVRDANVIERFISDEARSKVLWVDLRALGISNYGKMNARGFRRPYVNPGMELFFNDDAMPLSRWPNKEFLPIREVIDKGSVPRFGDFQNRGGVFKYDFSRPDKWRHFEDIWISGTFNQPWADDTIKIASINIQKKEIVMDQATMYGIESSFTESWGQKARGYFFVNILEEIDQPGEWYLDRENGVLYFWPPSPISKAKVFVSLLDEPMVAMENVSYITFRDLIFEVTRGIGIYIEGGESNLVAGCTLRNIGVVAVCIGRGIIPNKMLQHNFTGEPVSRQLGSWHEHIYDNTAFDRKGGKNHGVTDCNIYNIGAGAISLGGGDRKTLTAANNYVVNCDIHHYNRLDRSYKAAINIDGVGNSIAHNLIHHAPAMAIYLHGNDHIIEYNEIYEVVEGPTEDMGAFYMGRDPSERGNVVRYNFWHNIGNPKKMINSIYLDDGASGVVIYGNVFYKAGSEEMGVIMINGGWDNLVDNNVFIDCPTAINATARFQANKGELAKHIEAGGLWRVRLEKSIKHNIPPYSLRYPEFVNFFEKDLTQPSGNRLSHNVFCNIGAIMRESGTPKIIEDKNFQTVSDYDFVDATKKNFQFKNSSVVYQEIPDFKKIPFDKIGLCKNKHGKESENKEGNK